MPPNRAVYWSHRGQEIIADILVFHRERPILARLSIPAPEFPLVAYLCPLDDSSPKPLIMRILRLLPLFLLLPFFFTLSGISFSSCQKRSIFHDTTTVHDTMRTTVHDTTILHDTAYDLTSGLVAYYNFNNGNLNDSSVYHNNIVYNNATPAKDRHGVDGNAYSFDGTSSYMRVPNSPSLNPDNITMDVIIKVNGFNNGTCKGNSILDKGGNDDVSNGLYVMRYSDSIGCSVTNYDTTREVFYGSYGDNIPFGTTAGAGGTTVHVTTGTWYMLTYTYDGLNAKFYVNGVLRDSRPFSIPFTDNANDLLIGGTQYDQYPYWANAVIDEIRIYDRALPPQAVKQLYNQSK